MQVLSLTTSIFRDIRVIQPDGELVKAVLEGDRQAFGALVGRYERSVRAVAMGVLQDAHLAQDAAQNAFVKAYEKLAGLRKADAFGSWLLRISRRCALDMLPAKTEEALREVDYADTRASEMLDDEKRRLLGAVVKLRESERQVVMLRYFDCRSVKEVADIVGRSVGTVTKQLSRARRHLKVLLREA